MTESMTIDRDTVLTRAEGLVHSELDGEITMLNIENGKYCGLTRVATDIWKLIEQPMHVAAICDQLSREYKVEQAQCEEEVLVFLHHMASEHLVVIHP